jgi:hypothetical protein
MATRLGFSPYMRDVSEGEPGRSKRLETNDGAASLRFAIELELDLELRRPSVLDGEPLGFCSSAILPSILRRNHYRHRVAQLQSPTLITS